MKDSDRVDWDNAIREIGGSWLQSSGWAELQRRRRGRRVERVRVDGPSGTGMAQILFHHLGPVSIAYVPRGPIFSGDADAVAPLL